MTGESYAGFWKDPKTGKTRWKDAEKGFPRCPECKSIDLDIRIEERKDKKHNVFASCPKCNVRTLVGVINYFVKGKLPVKLVEMIPEDKSFVSPKVPDPRIRKIEFFKDPETGTMKMRIHGPKPKCPRCGNTNVKAEEKKDGTDLLLFGRCECGKRWLHARVPKERIFRNEEKPNISFYTDPETGYVRLRKPENPFSCSICGNMEITVMHELTEETLILFSDCPKCGKKDILVQVPKNEINVMSEPPADMKDYRHVTSQPRDAGDE